MDKLWCPVCDQGWVVAAVVKADRSSIWVCQECEVLWTGNVKPEREPDDTFTTHMEAKGLVGTWSELELSE